jgi:hypothetical protein
MPPALPDDKRKNCVAEASGWKSIKDNKSFLIEHGFVVSSKKYFVLYKHKNLL